MVLTSTQHGSRECFGLMCNNNGRYESGSLSREFGYSVRGVLG
jgi:hypothetical protein